MVQSSIKYLINEKGERTAVVISIEDWQNLQKELERYRQQAQLKEQLERSLLEVDLWKKGQKDLMSLEDFIENEC